MKNEENTAQMRGGGGGRINKLIWLDLEFIIIKTEREDLRAQISISFEILISKWCLKLSCHFIHPTNCSDTFTWHIIFF